VITMPAVRDVDAAEYEDLFERVPCGYLLTDPDGTVRKVNRTFEDWTGLRREDLLGRRRFQDLLAAPARIYHETHFSPALMMHGSVKEIASEIVRADGGCLPVFLNAALVDGVVRITVFDASQRRSYETELLRDRRDEHAIVEALQNSLLAGSLPSESRIEVVANYRPAVRGLDVGGDWFDTFWLDADRIAIGVGDVVGRGVAAAAAMGQLRSAIRAFASMGCRPAALLESLDSFAARHRVGAFATVAYAEIDLADRELRLACAGHPPPVLIEPEADPSMLWEGRSTPLTMQRPSRGSRPELSLTLAAQATLILYTDGLVERRSEDIDEGLERLLAVVGDVRDIPPADMARDVLRSLEHTDPHDDTCLLIASLKE
jgi:PAS domain S-box-containing protein